MRLKRRFRRFCWRCAIDQKHLIGFAAAREHRSPRLHCPCLDVTRARTGPRGSERCRTASISGRANAAPTRCPSRGWPRSAAVTISVQRLCDRRVTLRVMDCDAPRGHHLGWSRRDARAFAAVHRGREAIRESLLIAMAWDDRRPPPRRSPLPSRRPMHRRRTGYGDGGLPAGVSRCVRTGNDETGEPRTKSAPYRPPRARRRRLWETGARNSAGNEDPVQLSDPA